jgi:beta-N-acetylhexosaminidase
LDITLSLKEKIGQLFMIGFYGEELPTEVEAFIEKNNIGFIILFSRNIGSIAGSVALTNHIHSLGKITPAIYTDQEGGLVVRFGEMAATVISPMGLAATGDPRNARIAGRIIGKEMNSVGIDGVLAPVLDVNFEENNPVIGTRAFSDDPEIVISYAGEFASGLNESGVAACGKHYPGHGGTVKDSHLEIPTAPISPEYFSRYCFLPFAALAKADIDGIMSAHVKFPRITKDIATFSPYFIRELLREQAGFKGVIFSDCLEMNAVKDNFSPGKIARACVAAGIDVLCPSHHLDFQEELFRVLLFNVEKGIIPEKDIDESVGRVLKLKEKFNLLEKRKTVAAGRAEKQLRSSLAVEREIAGGAITLLRNGKNIIPLKKDKKCLILEWQQAKATTDSFDKETISPLIETARRYLPHIKSKTLKLGDKLPEDLKSLLSGYDYVIACPYSLNKKRARTLGRDIKQIIKTRKDVIVAAVGNPYDIRYFPEVETYIVTYGTRQVQLEAFFEVITGQVKPAGRLPVEIKGIFPRGYGLTLP